MIVDDNDHKFAFSDSLSSSSSIDICHPDLVLQDNQYIGSRNNGNQNLKPSYAVGVGCIRSEEFNGTAALSTKVLEGSKIVRNSAPLSGKRKLDAVSIPGDITYSIIFIIIFIITCINILTFIIT